MTSLKKFLRTFKERDYKLALDDFGAGFAGFELFYHLEPDFIKFDRFLISDNDKDLRKKTFCSHIVNLAKLLGVLTVAEGVENEAEFMVCHKLGFDLIQGYFIQTPI